MEWNNNHMEYKKYFKVKHYTLPELIQQVNEISRIFSIIDKSIVRGKLKLILKLKPTDYSIEYKILLTAKQNSEKVKIFVIEPKIVSLKNGNTIPHVFHDNSLCLYYPKHNEWNYREPWAETLIPWTSLWLFYYEIWKETGEWIGGGIHCNEYIPMI